MALPPASLRFFSGSDNSVRGYTMGLFDETGFAQLRLKLSRKLEVEILSGTSSRSISATLKHH